MTAVAETDLRQGVSPAMHAVLDALEHLAEGPLSRTTLDDVIAEIDLAGDTLFGIALAKGPDDEADAARAGRLAVQAVAAFRHSSAVRLAALLLLGLEKAAAELATVEAGL